MELKEISRPRSNHGEGCLGHDGTLKMIESWEKILSERQTVGEDVIRNNKITVNVGPRFEEVSLKNIENYLASNRKEWEEIQQFYCIPNFNKCDDFSEQKNRKNVGKYLGVAQSSFMYFESKCTYLEPHN